MFISCSAFHTVNIYIYNNIIHTNTLGDSANKKASKDQACLPLESYVSTLDECVIIFTVEEDNCDPICENPT